MFLYYSFEHVHMSVAENTDVLSSINTSYKRTSMCTDWWLLNCCSTSYVLAWCDEPWLGQQWQHRREKRDYTRNLYPTTNPTLKMRRSNLQKCRCFRLLFTFSGYFVCLCWPWHLILFYNSSGDVWQRVQITTIFSMQRSQYSYYFPSLCYATGFYCPITFPAFVTRLDFIVLLTL